MRRVTWFKQAQAYYISHATWNQVQTSTSVYKNATCLAPVEAVTPIVGFGVVLHVFERALVIGLDGRCVVGVGDALDHFPCGFGPSNSH